MSYPRVLFTKLLSDEGRVVCVHVCAHARVIFMLSDVLDTSVCMGARKWHAQPHKAAKEEKECSPICRVHSGPVPFSTSIYLSISGVKLVLE